MYMMFQNNTLLLGINHYNQINSGYGVRPVINLDSSKITFNGTGTMQDPYVIQ